MNAASNRLHAISLTAALAAGLLAYALVFAVAGEHFWAAIGGAIAGGWTLGRLRR